MSDGAGVPPHLRGGEPRPCDCPCHGDPTIQHFAACCAVCPRCGVRLAGGFDAHARACPAAAPGVR